MAKKGSVPLSNPLAGLSRRAEFQSQAPYTTPEVVNFLPSEALPGLRRLVTRPGLIAHNLGQMPSGSPGAPITYCRAIAAEISGVNRYFEDEATERADEREENWAVNTASTVAPQIDTHNKVWWHEYSAVNPVAAMFRTALGQDATKVLSWSMRGKPFNRRHRGSYFLYLMLDNAAPNPATVGYVCRVTISGTDDAVAWRVSKMQGSAEVSAWSGSTTLGHVDVRTIRAHYVPASTTLILNIGGTQVLSQNVGSAPTGAGTRIGWGIQPAASGDRMEVAGVHCSYQVTASESQTVFRVAAIANGKLLHERPFAAVTDAVNFTEVDATYSFNSTALLTSGERLGKTYIGDYSDVVYEDTNTLIGYNGAGPYYWKFETDPKVDLSASYGVSASSFVVELVQLYNGASPVTRDDFPVGFYSISALETNVTSNCTAVLTRPHNALPSAGTVVTRAHIRIYRIPKIYDAANGTVTKWETDPTLYISDLVNTTGTIPGGCGIVWEAFGRMWMAKNNAVKVSRRGDPLDFFPSLDYTGDPDGGFEMQAVLGDQIGHKITAGFKIDENSVIIGTADQIYLIDGDPLFGGQMSELSNRTGILSPHAWCLDNSGKLWILSRYGLFQVQGRAVIPASPQIPNELLNLDATKIHAQLIFDQREKFIRIFLTGKEQRLRRYHWVFDPETGGFWPITTQDAHDPLAVCQAAGFYSGESHVLLGCRDGVLRRYDRHALTDAGSAINSRIVFGPVRAGAGGTEARVDEVMVTLGSESEACDIDIVAGRTAGEAVERSRLLDSDFTHRTTVRGYNRGIKPRIRGRAFCYHVRSVSGGRIVLDGLESQAMPVGTVKME